MATRTTVTLVDDLDGMAADETVPFGLDGAEYEIDLSADHAKELRSSLESYVAAARRTGGRRSTTSTSSSSRIQKPTNGASRERNQEIRTWAASHGAMLADRGRIPGHVIEAFEAGDASRLTGASDNASDEASAALPSAAQQSAPSNDAEQSRGRDGLTAPERERIRQWATNEGIEVKARGILKKDLISNYEAWSARHN